MKHSIRQVKVTLYLDVPTLDDNDKFLDECKIIETCENSLRQNKFYVNAPSEVVLGPVESDDLEAMISEAKLNNDNVVGFLTPDAKWYLMFCSENGLSHIKLANLIYPYYKYELCYDLNHDLHFLDTALEKSGFVKVHGENIRYFSDVGTKLNDKQINELIKYMKLQKEIYINDKFVNVNKISQMDYFSFNMLFEI